MVIAWAVAIAVLLAAGVVCGYVIVPALQMRTALEDLECGRITPPRAIERLGGPRRAAARLSALVEGTRHERGRREQAFGLLISCGDAGTEALVRFLAGKDLFLRRRAAGSLSARFYSGYFYLVSHSPPPPPWAVVRNDPVVAVPALTAALGDEDAEVRRAAAQSLGSYGSAARPALPALRRALEDPDERVRKKAAAALRLIDPQPEGYKPL